MLHNNGYINSCKEFTFKVKHGFFTWKYNRSFNCNSINVIYMLICAKCGDNYIGETQNLWKYNRSFNCNSINVIYMLICAKCGDNYIGETQNLRERTNHSKSKVRYSENNSLEYTKHFSHCSNLIEP